MSGTTNTETTEGTPKKKSKLILLIVPLLLILIGGGAYYFFFMTGASAEKDKSAKAEKYEEEEPEESEEEADGKKSGKKSASLKAALPSDEDVKQVVELQPFVVNLTDSEQNRYLRLTVSVGVGGEHGGGGHDKPDTLFITRIRNAMLAVLTLKSSEDVLTVEGKSKLRKELLKAAQAASEHPHVEAIYITDFIVQL